MLDLLLAELLEHQVAHPLLLRAAPLAADGLLLLGALTLHEGDLRHHALSSVQGALLPELDQALHGYEVGMVRLQSLCKHQCSLGSTKQEKHTTMAKQGARDVLVGNWPEWECWGCLLTGGLIQPCRDSLSPAVPSLAAVREAVKVGLQLDGTRCLEKR